MIPHLQNMIQIAFGDKLLFEDTAYQIASSYISTNQEGTNIQN